MWLATLGVGAGAARLVLGARCPWRARPETLDEIPTGAAHVARMLLGLVRL